MKTMENKQCCSTCKWYEPNVEACCNPESEDIIDTSSDNTCDNWEEITVKPDDLSEEWKVLEAAGILKQYCKQHPCGDCPLRTVNYGDAPMTWNLPTEP